MLVFSLLFLPTLAEACGGHGGGHGVDIADMGSSMLACVVDLAAGSMVAGMVGPTRHLRLMRPIRCVMRLFRTLGKPIEP